MLVACCPLCTSSKAAAAAHSFRLGCFNIENFGQTKLSRDAVMDAIVRIAQRYDVLIIQELSDSSQVPDLGPNIGKVISETATRIQERSNDKTIRVVASPRLSRTGNGKEQYALVYDHGAFDVLESWVVNDSATGEPAYEQYMRPPMVTRMRSTRVGEDFVVGVCHTRPQDALNETLHMLALLKQLEQSTSKLAMVCGDFNARFAKDEWKQFEDALPANGSMEIPKGAATGVLSGATLDLIITASAMHKRVQSAQVYRFNDTSAGGFSVESILQEGCNNYLSECTALAATKAVSDHYPVEVVLQLDGSSTAQLCALLAITLLLTYIR